MWLSCFSLICILFCYSTRCLFLLVPPQKNSKYCHDYRRQKSILFGFFLCSADSFGIAPIEKNAKRKKLLILTFEAKQCSLPKLHFFHIYRQLASNICISSIFPPIHYVEKLSHIFLFLRNFFALIIRY